jgi:transposase
MQPTHHGLRMAPGARRHLGGAASLSHVVEGERALAGASMRCVQGQPPQVIRCLTPASTINPQHETNRIRGKCLRWERPPPDEIADLDTMIGAIVDELAPDLVARPSIGHTSAAQLLLTAGDNLERLRSEASFAALCGVSPVPASSGKTIRHRLNRGGDRAANSALHIIAIVRLRTDPTTKAYVAKRIAEGHSKLDAIRSLKRYIAREVFTLIMRRQKEINQTRIVA